MQLFLSDTQLAERYGVSRATVWRWVQRGILPSPQKIGPGTTRWSLEQIEQIDEQRRARTSAA